MARKKAIDISKKETVTAQRVFTDREEPQASFQKRLGKVNERKYSILHFYGVGGIGKTSLQKHLQKEHLDKDENAIYSWIDFEKEENQYEHNAYRFLANRFSQKFKVKFTTFDIAYTIYLKKAHPNMEISKQALPFVEEGSIVASAIDQLEEVGGWASLGVGLVKYAVEKIQDMSFNSIIQKKLEELDTLEADEIEKGLVGFFAHDIKTFQEKNTNKKVIIFLDTYEALWRNDRKESNILAKDAWVRDNLVTNLLNVLFVSCGREKLRWEEDDVSWIEIENDSLSDLEQHTIGNLSAHDAQFFLDSCNIKEEIIQNAIIQSSEGVPFYLDLCVETYYRMKEANKELVTSEFDNVEQYKIFERFMRYLDKEEVATLKVLSVANFYDTTLFQKTIEYFTTGYPATDIQLFNSFSFIKTEEDQFFIHNLMRTSLINNIKKDNSRFIEIHKFYFEYYNNQLKDIDIKNILIEKEIALQEAFYHKFKLGCLKELNKWFQPLYNLFVASTSYKVLINLVSQLVSYNEAACEEYSLTEPTYTISGNYIYKYANVKNSEVAQFRATGYTHSAQLFYKLGNYEIAQHDYEKALVIFQKIYKEEHPDIATIYNHLADIFHDLGDYEKSLPYYEKALQIREKVLGEEHLHTSSSYYSLATFYSSIGEYEKALPLHLKALNIREKVLGEKHIETANSYNNLAILYSDVGYFEKAKIYNKKALTIYQAILGEEHTNTAHTYNNLGLIYYKLGDYNKAQPLFEKALKIREKTLGGEHFDTASSYNNLALVYSDIGMYEKSESCYKVALSVYEDILGEAHPDTATTYDNLAILYHKIQEYRKAEPLYEKALKIREKVVGKEHKDTASSYHNLASLYYQLEKYNKAEPLYKNALIIREKVLVMSHPDIGNSYSGLGLLYLQLEEYNQAYLLLKKAFKLFQEIYSPEHERTLFIREILDALESEIL